jgi:hypothetical protein
MQLRKDTGSKTPALIQELLYSIRTNPAAIRAWREFVRPSLEQGTQPELLKSIVDRWNIVFQEGGPPLSDDLIADLLKHLNTSIVVSVALMDSAVTDWELANPNGPPGIVQRLRRLPHLIVFQGNHQEELREVAEFVQFELLERQRTENLIRVLERLIFADSIGDVVRLRVRTSGPYGMRQKNLVAASFQHAEISRASLHLGKARSKPDAVEWIGFPNALQPDFFETWNRLAE